MEMNNARGPVVKDRLLVRKREPWSVGDNIERDRDRGGPDEAPGAGRPLRWGRDRAAGAGDAEARGVTPDVTEGSSSQKLREGNG